MPFRWQVPNLYLEAHDAYTCTEGNGIPRCVHHPNATYFDNIHMDRTAEAIGMDPTEFIRKNTFKGSGAGTHQDTPQYDIGANPNPEFWDKLVQLSAWKTKWQGWGNPVSVNGSKKKGIGCAIHNCSHGSLSNPESATISARSDGTFLIACGSQDVGQGWRTCAQIMAAEELSVDLDSIYSPGFDTDTVQESRSPGGSTVTRGSGTAMILACRDLKEQLFKLAIAAGLIDATNPEELETENNNIVVKADKTKSVAIKNVCARQNTTYVDSEMGTWFGGPLIGRGSYATKRSGGSMMHMQWSSAVAEVEVDTDTGEVTVEKVTEVASDGRTIWWKGEMSQIWGGILFMVGSALYTGTIRDEPTGCILNPDYSLYKCPTFADCPDMVVDTYNEIEPYGPFGAKGSGEPVMPPTGPAVANAIYNACGVRTDQTHMTPDYILTALGKV
jgi:CO/xanthine dehydrogenase Mo-binding subunit